MHDYDNNSKLDGLEIFQGLSHHEHSREEGKVINSAWSNCWYHLPFSDSGRGGGGGVCVTVPNPDYQQRFLSGSKQTD